jgi:hypothetical protein
MTKKKSNNVEYKKCLKCERDRNITKEFYMSNSANHLDKRYPICKSCIKSNLNIEENTGFHSEEFLDLFQNVMLEMNRPFIYSLYSTSVEESKRENKELLGIYLKNVLLNFRTMTWKDSEFSDTKNELGIHDDNSSSPTKVQVLDNRNKDDVLRMLGYDPFETETKEDRKYLYNRLVDFLDEGTLEDSFKLPAVIEIVKAFNQIDKINKALSIITSDTASLAKNVGGVKSLIDSKEKMLKSVLALAKDNGISVNHNNNKSKGGGTLSGIMKQLQEKGFEEAEVNLFDIETAKGIRQVADLSNQSIVAQLQFDENDYTQMIMEQREIIQEQDSKIMKLEEENRLIKKELLKYRKNELSGGDIDE